MDSIIPIVNFTFSMISSIFTWMFQSWVTACLPIAMILVLIVGLVISSASGTDDK